MDLYALQLPRTIGMLEKATDPCWGLQDYTKNTLVHFSYTICTNIAQYYLYLHSKRKMPLIHTPPFSLRHDVQSPLFHSGPFWHTLAKKSQLWHIDLSSSDFHITTHTRRLNWRPLCTIWTLVHNQKNQRNANFQHSPLITSKIVSICTFR